MWNSSTSWTFFPWLCRTFQNIWNSWIKERLLPPFLQHPAISKLCWVHAWQILLRPWRYVHSAQRWIPQVVRWKSIKKIHFQFSTWTLKLLPIRCKTPQTGVYDLSIPVQRYCRLQPYKTLHHHCFPFQCGIPQKMDAWKQNLRRTSTGMASPSHSIPCCSKMALLRRIKTDKNQSCAPNCSCQKQRWKKIVPRTKNISGRWIWWANKDLLRVSGLFLPWMYQLLSQSHHETPY